MGKKRSALLNHLFSVTVAAAFTFSATSYWNSRNDAKDLREKRVQVLDDLVTMSAAMSHNMKFMSLLSCEFAKKRLSRQEQNQRTADHNRLVVEAQEKIDRMGNRLSVYFPGRTIHSDFHRVTERYGVALNELQISINEAVAGAKCRDDVRSALLEKHIRSVGWAMEELSSHMRAQIQPD